MENNINGTLIWYYFICKREVWLMARHLIPAQDDTNIAIGRLIKEDTYEREKKEVRIDNIVMDLVKKENNQILVGEVKKSSKFLKGAKMQLLYYLYYLKTKGIVAKGELLFPKEKERIEVELTEDNEKELQTAITEIEKIMLSDKPPELKKIKFCKSIIINDKREKVQPENSN